MADLKDAISKCLVAHCYKLWNEETNSSLLQELKKIPGLENEKITFDFNGSNKKLTIYAGDKCTVVSKLP